MNRQVHYNLFQSHQSMKAPFRKVIKQLNSVLLNLLLIFLSLLSFSLTGICLGQSFCHFELYLSLVFLILSCVFFSSSGQSLCLLPGFLFLRFPTNKDIVKAHLCIFLQCPSITSMISNVFYQIISNNIDVFF